MSVLFYTSANREYEFFVPLYIYFSLTFNSDAYVEILLENAPKYESENKNLIEKLNVLFPNRFKLTSANFDNYLPSVIRFINEPSFATDCEYVYIGDIDILILDNDVESQHVKNMKQTGSKISNIMRPKKHSSGTNRRLSGLHFAPMQLQYPLGEFPDLDITKYNKTPGADEMFLYGLMRKKGIKLPEGLIFRPEHGIHISLNRHPYGEPLFSKYRNLDVDSILKGNQIDHWSGIEKKEYREKFMKIIKDENFREIYFDLSQRSRNILNILENISTDNFIEFQNELKKIVFKKPLSYTSFRKRLNHNKHISMLKNWIK